MNRINIIRNCIFFSIAITFTACESGDENPYFIKTFNFGKNDNTISLSINQNGETVICGYTSSFMTSTEALVMKISPTGNTMWMKTFGNTGFDMGIDIVNISDQKSILTGRVTRNKLYDTYILNINHFGQLVWSKYLNFERRDEPFRVYPDDQDGFYMTSYKNGDMRIFRFDRFGDTIWSKTIGKFKGLDFGRSMHKKSDGHLLLCGNSNSFTPEQTPFVMELDQNGNEIWTSVIEMPNIAYIYDLAVIETEGIYLAGHYRVSIMGNYKAILIKTDMSGHLAWIKALDYPSSNDVYYDIEITRKKELLVGGYVTTNTHSQQLLLAKSTSDGDMLWVHTFGNSENERGYRIGELPNGDILSVGTSTVLGALFSDIYLVKVNEKGLIP